MALKDKLDELAECVATILGDCGRPDDVFPDVPDAVKFFSRDRHMLNQECALGETGTASLAQATDLCMDVPEVRGTTTRGEVEKAIEQALVEGLSDGTAVGDIVEALATNITEGRQTMHVFMPIMNLNLKIDPIQIGNVTLLPASDNSAQQKYSRLADGLNEQTWEKSIDEGSVPLTWALTEVTAVKGSEFEIAEAVTEEVLNYIRCIAASAKGLSGDDFGLPTSFGSGLRAQASFDENDRISSHRFTKHNTVGQQIDDEAIKYMRDFGMLDRVDALLRIPPWERNEMETRLSAALHWAGRATMESIPAYQAADYAIAIDALVLDRQSQHSSEFADRTHWLVQQWCEREEVAFEDISFGSRVTNAQELRTWAKRFYSKGRCGVVHDGDIWLSQELEQTLGLWPPIALMGISVVARKLDEWSTFDDFEKAYDSPV